MWYLKGVEGAEEQYVVAHSEEGAYARARSLYGDAVKLEQDPDVLDTWFSRSVWDANYSLDFPPTFFSHNPIPMVCSLRCHLWSPDGQKLSS